jgi:hypothetical protein
MSTEWNKLDYFEDSSLTALLNENAMSAEEEGRLRQFFNFSKCVSTEDLRNRMVKYEETGLIKTDQSSRMNFNHEITFKNGLDIYKTNLDKKMYAIVKKVTKLLAKRSIKEFRLLVIKDCKSRGHIKYISISAFIFEEGQIESYEFKCEYPYE